MGGAAADLELHDADRLHLVREVATESELDAWLGVAEDWGLVDGPRSRARLGPVLHGLAFARPALLRMQIAWADELAVGAISARRLDEVLLIDHLGVRSGSQRNGVGRALIAAAVRAEPAALQVILAPTPSSVAFYERLGFLLQRYPPYRSYYLPATPGESE
jgi:GNAT superfamily N-acetyltransferase